MKILSINTSLPYSIYIEQDLLKTSLLKECCIRENKKIVIITDSNLINFIGKNLQVILQKQGIHAELFSFHAGEQNKTRETKHILEDELLLKKYGRDTCIIALGGGVVLDIAGFLAATYCRGVPVIYIPTTLLAMVDASIGGKTGVNTPHGKNLIGTFTQPQSVFIDVSLLNTLPKKEFSNGMVEIIKHSLIADASLFDLLKKNILKIDDIIYKSCEIKKAIIEQDEYEKNKRQLLNFGHTIGHAIEKIENYYISHGEAVAIGMLVESYLSIQCGYLEENTLITLQEMLEYYDLPLKTSAFQDKEIFKNILMLDKKSINHTPQFVLLDAIGKPHQQDNHYTTPVDIAHLNAALDWAAEIFKSKSL